MVYRESISSLNFAQWASVYWSTCSQFKVAPVPLGFFPLSSSSRQIFSAMSCPWFCTISLQFSSRSFYSSLFSSPNHSSYHFLSFFLLSLTLKSFPLLHISTRLSLLSSFFFIPLDIIPLCDVTFATPRRLCSFIRSILLVSSSTVFPTILLSITRFRSSNSPRSKFSLYILPSVVPYRLSQILIPGSTFQL